MDACGRRWGNAGGWTAPGSWSHRTTVKQENSGSEVTHDRVGGTNRRMVVFPRRTAPSREDSRKSGIPKFQSPLFCLVISCARVTWEFPSAKNCRKTLLILATLLSFANFSKSISRIFMVD